MTDDDNLQRAAADLDRVIGQQSPHPLSEAEEALRASRPEDAARLASEHALFGPAADRAESLVIYADAMASLGEPEAATDGYRAALLADPASFLALFGLALLRHEAGEDRDARELAAQALRIACSQEFGLDYRARQLASMLDALGGRAELLEVLAEHGVGPQSLVLSWLARREV